MDDLPRKVINSGIHPINTSARPSDSQGPSSQNTRQLGLGLPIENSAGRGTIHQDMTRKYDDLEESTAPEESASTSSQPHVQYNAALEAPDDSGVGQNDGETSSDAGEAQNIDDENTQFTVDDFMNQEAESHETEQNAYTLRSNFQSAPVGFNTTFVDKDPTGDYDPVAERRALIGKRRSAKNQAVHRERPMGTRNPLPLPTLMVTFRYYTEHTRQSIADILSRLPANQPQEAVPDYKGYGLRRRDHDASLTEGDGIVARLPDDLTGHPMARGCYSCAGMALRCPLLDQSELTWPCTTCEEDGHDCQLIVEPCEKLACESCRGLKKSCSFTYGSTYKGPCELCKKLQFQCIAGPTKLAAAVRTRLTYDRDYDVYPLGKRPRLCIITECKHCKEVGYDCTLKVDDDGGPCTGCEMDGVVCGREEHEIMVDGTEDTNGKKHKKSRGKAKTQRKRRDKDEGKAKDDDDEVLVVPQPSKSRGLPTIGGSKDLAIELSDDGYSSPMEIDDDQIHGPVISQAQAPSTTATIKTRFCHPVIFQHPRNAACSFCQKPSYPFTGLAPKTVTVEELPNGKGYREISGGHAANKGNTVLCTVCTVERLRIILCSMHRPLWLPNAQPTSRAAGAWIRLIERDKRQDPDLWCSLCNNMAAFRCDAVQATNATGEAIQKHDPEVFGCGLRLCIHCRIAMQVTKGDLQTALETIPDRFTAIRPRGLRADAELYKHAPDGLLVNFIISTEAES